MALLEDFSKLSGMYYRYKKTSDEDIAKHLKTIKIVIQKGDSYYALNHDAMQRISEKPRNLSLSFDMMSDFDQLKCNLVVFKEILYLVKSSSRFFLKPDIGEIFDQIYHIDFYHDKFNAICYYPESHQLLDGTDGEHFIMPASLLKLDDEVIQNTDDFYE